MQLYLCSKHSPIPRESDMRDSTVLTKSLIRDQTISQCGWITTITGDKVHHQQFWNFIITRITNSIFIRLKATINISYFIVSIKSVNRKYFFANKIFYFWMQKSTNNSHLLEITFQFSWKIMQLITVQTTKWIKWIPYWW